MSHERKFAKVSSGVVRAAQWPSAEPKNLKEAVPERVAVADRPNDAYEN